MNIIKLLFPAPSTPSWGEEVEYHDKFYDKLNTKQTSIEDLFYPIWDGSGPREFSLPPLYLFNLQNVFDISIILSNFPFDWSQIDPKYNEVSDYGMGRHLHYRPINSNGYYDYEHFLQKNLFDKQLHNLFYVLTPFLTPNVEINNNYITPFFRPSINEWAKYTYKPTDSHYAFININVYNDYKPTTVEIRHNEAHPFEAYAFMLLFHTMLHTDQQFEAKHKYENFESKIIMNNKTIDISDTYYSIPLDIFKDVVQKYAQFLPRTYQQYIYRVMQNILLQKRIFENDEPEKIYKQYSKRFEKSKYINDVLEDYFNDNIKMQINASKININEYGNVIIYANRITLTSPKYRKVINVTNTIWINRNVAIKPTTVKKATKKITLN